VTALDLPEEPTPLWRAEHGGHGGHCCGCTERIGPRETIMVAGSCAYHCACWLHEQAERQPIDHQATA
jgi:hypothetical protein